MNESTAKDKMPSYMASFKCTRCGSIEMLDMTGLTEDFIREFTKCPYLCNRCLINQYP